MAIHNQQPQQPPEPFYPVPDIQLDYIQQWLSQNPPQTRLDGVAGILLNIHSGSGDPDGVVTASPGALYLNTDGGVSTTLYVKESGSGNTGWVGK